MKYIEKKYQELISDMQRAHDNLVNDLKYHISYLQGIIKGQDEKIEELEHPDKLQQEIDEYNRLEAQRNMNLEDEVTQLKAKLVEKESDLKEAYGTIEAWENRFYTLVKAYGIDLDKPVKADAAVHHCGEGEPKVYKPKTKKTNKHWKRGMKMPKNILCRCVDCKKYYYAASKLSKRCDECSKKHVCEYQRAWKKKHYDKN